MDTNSFNEFDNACMKGDISLAKNMLRESRPTQWQLNTALRHAAAYSAPTDEIREELIDFLIKYGAVIDWNDRGLETITNAVSTGNNYVLKQVLNACDGNEERLDCAVRSVSVKGKEWAVDLILKRKNHSEDYLTACRAIHQELARIAERTRLMAETRCADPSNPDWIKEMGQQDELLECLTKLDSEALT